MKTAGTEALDRKDEKKPKGEKPADKKDGKKGEHKGGMRLAEIRTKPLADGTFHHEHHMEDKHGMPHHKTFGYSSATKEDAADHMMEHLPEPPQGAGAGEPDGDEAAGAAGAGQPGTSQPAPGEVEE